MEHFRDIQAYIKTLMESPDFHALVVMSPPGWGKSTTIERALGDLGIQAVSGGSYATPLHIYNTLCQAPASMILFDDCAGVFSDPKAMAILKAATWTVGTARKSQANGMAGARRVAWGSTSDKVEEPHVDFRGKLILLTSTLPAGKETEAFLSRCLTYEIEITREDAKRLLISAARSAEHFPDLKKAREVAEYLVRSSTRVDFSKVSLRTLKLGYNIAMSHPTDWRDYFVKLLPRDEAKKAAVAKILKSGMPAKEQEAKFLSMTGMSRRSFYNYKKRMGMTRAYQKKK